MDKHRKKDYSFIII